MHAAVGLPLPHPLPACARALRAQEVPALAADGGPCRWPAISGEEIAPPARCAVARRHRPTRWRDCSGFSGASAAASSRLRDPTSEIIDEEAIARPDKDSATNKNILLALGLALAAAASTAQTLRIGLAEDPDVLDPSLARTFVGRIVFAALCDKLVDIDEKLNIVPQLATRWHGRPTTRR